MSQQRLFDHRKSVPNEHYQQYQQLGRSTQPRAFSVAHSSLHGESFASAEHSGLQWRNEHDFMPNGSNVWQQQYNQAQNTPQQANSISNTILGEIEGIEDVLQSRSSNDAPWNPHGSQQQNPQLFDPAQFRTGSGAATVVPDTRSQQGSFAQDSAYFSQPSYKRSAPSDEASQQASEHFLALQPDGAPKGTGNKSPRSVVSDTQLQHIHKRSKRSAEAKLRCPRDGCNKDDLKNRSDLMKHMNQHNKPFFCQEPGCEREEGFGTTNDRERHRASVHGLQPRCGTTVGFICFACEQSNPSQKWWPRKDNFRSHIGRKHPDWNVDYLVEISSKDTRPIDAQTEVRSAPSTHGNDEDHLQSGFSWTLAPSSQTEFHLSSPGNEGDVLAGGGQWANGDIPLRHVPPNTMSMPGIVHANSFHQQPAITIMRAEISPPDSAPRAAEFTALTRRVSDQAKQFAPQSFDNPGWVQPPASAHPAPGNMHSTADPSTGHKCPQCNKVKKRACDLRKHEKRHSRPYGCTFPRCFRRFGSRNDWKRHENAQHAIREQWRCQLPTQDGAACGKLCDKQDDMSFHLDNRHGNEGYSHDSPLHWVTLSASHIGKEAHHSFWCGFCNSIRPRRESKQQDKCLDKPDLRSQHIGDHFDKGVHNIDDWYDIEENKQKRHIAVPTVPKRSTGGSSAEESDLGDHGIPDPAGPVSGYTAPFSRLAGGSMHVHARKKFYPRKKRMDPEDDAEGESDNEF